MASVGSSILPSPQSASSTTVTIFNTTATLANTEYSQALPANTKEFLMKVRGSAALKVAFISGDSGTLYVTINKGAVLTVTQFFSSQTIYFQSPVAGSVVEIVAFS